MLVTPSILMACSILGWEVILLLFFSFFFKMARQFKGIQVCRVPRPAYDGELLLILLQVIHDQLALVAGGPILQEDTAPLQPHEWDKVALKD